jgi:hypothetical protein
MLIVILGCLGGSLVRADDSNVAWRTLDFVEAKDGWQVSQFGGRGPVEFVGDGLVKIGRGDPLSGVHYKGEIPRDDFELELEARRVEGIDFFCGLTFPVGDQRCSLIVGGWAGTVVGLSNVDDEDAAHNETQRIETFENGQWYRIRIRVSKDRIAAWIDDRLMVDQPRGEHRFDVRPEVLPSLPLGLAVFASRGEARSLRIRSLQDGER